MFQFEFNFEDGVDDANDATLAGTVVSPTDEAHDTAPTTQQYGEPFTELDLDTLLGTLPTQLTYSFISVPSSDGTPDLQLARRDLFDARFQLISEGTGDPDSAGQASSGSDAHPSFSASALQFIDQPSDLVPLVYEGGLKTWECSLDLASCLRYKGYVHIGGRRVLELGCGTAMPTLCILRKIFSSPAGDAETHVHLQDYNASVLQLVTTPNVLLAWYTSPAADAYRSSDHDASEAADLELHITPELLHAFKTSLRGYKLSLRFFFGSWDTFNLGRTGGPYHLVLTSETIYHPTSLLSLVRVLRDACDGGGDRVCLVAAKTVYFGVGGGISEFIRCVESVVDGGHVETIWEKATGISRKVMRVRWT